MDACLDCVARTEVEALIYSYGWLCDKADWPALADMLADAELVYPGGSRRAARAEIERLWAGAVKTYEAGSPFTRHLINNIEIQFDRDYQHAVSRCSQTVIQGHFPEFPAQIVMTSRVYQSFALEGDRWKLVQREVINDWAGNWRYHLEQEPTMSLPRSAPSARYLVFA
jgi:ketosteroid isomerase-like protein